MDVELKKEWIERLRSGKYPQGKSALRYIDSEGTTRYCCWGVLMDILVEQGQAAWVSNGYVISIGAVCYNVQPTDSDELWQICPPADMVSASQWLIDWLGDMNDGTEDYLYDPQNFEQIADWIKNNVSDDDG